MIVIYMEKSFVIAKRVGVKGAFGFDDHFKTMGFILKPVKTE
jgi:predicted nucleic acid-binding protein